MGLEDALVLTETLREIDDLEVALETFAKRRYDRVTTIARNSAAVCDLLLGGPLVDGEQFFAPFDDIVLRLLAEKP